MRLDAYNEAEGLDNWVEVCYALRGEITKGRKHMDTFVVVGLVILGLVIIGEVLR